MTRRDIAVVRLVLGAFACLALTVAVGFAPEQIAAGEHLSWAGMAPEACGGCPMCGLSRGFAHGVRGELGRALSLNALFPLYFLTVLAVAAQAPLALVELTRSRPSSRRIPS